MRTRITELFGIKHPIIQGGMHRVGYAELAAAVSNAGGLGIITGLTQPTPEDLAREIDRCRDMTDKPFGVNLTFLPSFVAPPYPEYIHAIVGGGVRIVENRRPQSSAIHPGLEGARRKSHPQMHFGASFADRRADWVRCNQRRRLRMRRPSRRRRHPQHDSAAAGCRGAKIPFVESGGMADGRSLVAALALGADGINMGTQFIATREASAHENVKQALVAANELQTRLIMRPLRTRALQRSVRLVLTRQQMYVLGYRPAMIQQIELGASAGGTLEAVTPEAITVTSQYEDYYRQETGWSGLLYKSAHAKYAHKLARLDLATPCDMRAPSAPTGFFALECAMDELAVALKLDPLELRLRCYSDRDQHNDRPYSSKNLRECYHQGAEAFGWNKRIPEPRSMRDGTELVGLGMATGVWEALQVPITVRIVLTANGDAEVSCATSDIGTGTYTIMTQVAAACSGYRLTMSR